MLLLCLPFAKSVKNLPTCRRGNGNGNGNGYPDCKPSERHDSMFYPHDRPPSYHPGLSYKILYTSSSILGETSNHYNRPSHPRCFGGSKAGTIAAARCEKTCQPCRCHSTKPLRLEYRQFAFTSTRRRSRGGPWLAEKDRKEGDCTIEPHQYT